MIQKRIKIEKVLEALGAPVEVEGGAEKQLNYIIYINLFRNLYKSFNTFLGIFSLILLFTFYFMLMHNIMHLYDIFFGEKLFELCIIGFNWF